MSDAIDTSAEAVERLAAAMDARIIEAYGGHGTVLEMPDVDCNDAAATLRALAAERDALAKEREDERTALNRAIELRDQVIAKRVAQLEAADAALAALAPFVAQIKAAAFKRGAEAMREANAAVVDAHAAAAKRCSEEGDVIYRIRAEFLANSYAIQSAADDVRVTPIPEDKP